jgi:hypothetical protein
MAAIEFEAIINNGSIVVPEEYRNRLKGPVRVRVAGEEKYSAGKLIDDFWLSR